MPGGHTKLDQGFRANRANNLRAVTRLEESRHGPAYLFLMTVCACVLGSFVLVYIILH